MTKEQTDRIISEYTKKIYGFALSKTASIERAEELASRIILEVYASLLRQDEVRDTAAYIWRIAMNVRARFTDELANTHCELDDSLPDETDFTEQIIESDTAAKLRLEIAYLSKLRRRILILHYYKNMKLNDIAKTLSIPTGTIKWNLAAARDELREGLTKMRGTGILGIAPIELTRLSHDGRPGKFGATEYFLSGRLAQNIVWAAYKKPRSLTEIADELGISPIWIEYEIEELEEYGFLDRIGTKYLTNVLISDPSPETDIKVHELYMTYAREVAKTYPATVIEAINSLDKSEIYIPENDSNLLIWLGMAMALREKINIAFDNDAYEKLKVPRKDGGCYIAAASVKKKYDLPFDNRLYTTCGPMTRDTNKYPVYSWQLNTYYDTRALGYTCNKWEDWEYLYEFMTGRIKKEPENIEKYMRLCDKGYITKNDMVNVVCMKHHGERLEETPLMKALPNPNEHESALISELAEKLCNLIVPQYPEHMRPVATLYNSCPSICMYVIELLVKDGRLKLPSELHAPGLCSVIFSDRLPN